MEIENRSMEIIAPHLQGLNLTEDQVKVYSRIIHAAGDVEYAPIIRLHPELIDSARRALEKGCNIYTDISDTINFGEIGSIVAFIALICVMIYTIESGKKNA